MPFGTTLHAFEAGPSGARLDLHKESSDPGIQKGPWVQAVGEVGKAKPPGECTRWPAHMRLLNETTGELIEGRCHSTNLCAYCATLKAVENAEMATIDVLNGGAAPTIFCVLTTRTPTLDMSGFYRSREAVFKALRRRWPAVQIATVLEFTTGTGQRAAGARRPHWNLLLKHVPVDDLDQVADVVASVWCSREDALPRAQHFQRVHAIEGLSRYLMLHFQKYSQAPPPGFKGHRFTHTRGYFSEGTAATRQAAKESLATKRALWRAHQRGLEGHEAEQAVQRELDAAAGAEWRLIDIEAVRLAERRRQPAPRRPGPAPRTTDVGPERPSEAVAMPKEEDEAPRPAAWDGWPDTEREAKTEDRPTLEPAARPPSPGSPPASSQTPVSTELREQLGKRGITVSRTSTANAASGICRPEVSACNP